MLGGSVCKWRCDCIIKAAAEYKFLPKVYSKDLLLNYVQNYVTRQAVKDCIKQSSSLSSGALRVGCLDWPPLVSPEIILQVQQASVMDATIDAFTKVSGQHLPLLPLLLGQPDPSYAPSFPNTSQFVPVNFVTLL